MVLFNTGENGEKIQKSKKLAHMQKHFKKKKPKVVGIDWLLDSMIQGKVQDSSAYEIDFARHLNH